MWAAQSCACRMRITEQSPYKAANYEQMDANHQCDVILQDLDVYLALSKWYIPPGLWARLASVRAARAGKGVRDNKVSGPSRREFGSSIRRASLEAAGCVSPVQADGLPNRHS